MLVKGQVVDVRRATKNEGKGKEQREFNILKRFLVRVEI